MNGLDVRIAQENNCTILHYISCSQRNYAKYQELYVKLTMTVILQQLH